MHGSGPCLHCGETWVPTTSSTTESKVYCSFSESFHVHQNPTAVQHNKTYNHGELGGKAYFSCNTGLWTSRASSSFMAVNLQFITESWDKQSWCLGYVGLHSEHMGDSLRKASEEIVKETWKLDIANMTGITTDNATNNKKAFEQDFTWVPCFGHNLHLAINKGLDIGHVSGALSRLRKMVAAFSRSPKMH